MPYRPRVNASRASGAAAAAQQEPNTSDSGSKARCVVRPTVGRRDGTRRQRRPRSPVLWLIPPSYEIQSRQVLAAHIADFLHITLESVLQAFAESYDGPWQIYGGENDYEPEPPLANP